MSPKPSKQLFSVAEAAGHLGVTDDWVRKLCRSGALGGVKIGEFQWVIPADALNKAKRERQNTTN